MFFEKKKTVLVFVYFGHQKSLDTLYLEPRILELSTSLISSMNIDLLEVDDMFILRILESSNSSIHRLVVTHHGGGNAIVIVE